MPPDIFIPHGLSTLHRCSLTTFAQDEPYHEKAVGYETGNISVASEYLFSSRICYKLQRELNKYKQLTFMFSFVCCCFHQGTSRKVLQELVTSIKTLHNESSLFLAAKAYQMVGWIRFILMIY